MDQYIVIIGRHTTIRSNVVMEYNWDGKKFKTRDEAKMHGLNAVHCDDFNIGLIQNNEKTGHEDKLTRFFWMDDELTSYDLAEISAHIGI